MRKIFVSAGHSNRVGRDRGASGNGYVEGELTVEFRNLLVNELKLRGATPVVDADDSVLSQTLNFFRNLTTNSCIVLDIHWNAASPQATGTETLVPVQPSVFELDLAQALSQDVHDILGIPLRGNSQGRRGVKTEADSHHGRLGWMRLTGENVLMEICFISNAADMRAYQANKQRLVKKVADTLINFARRTTGQAATQPPQGQFHTVVSNESLWSIARKYNTTIPVIQKLNNLTSDRIIVGQRLRVS